MKVSSIVSPQKTPTVQIDKALNKYDNVVLFPDKLAKANQMLKMVGFPKLKLHNR